jgi:hypothetical protein
MRYEIIGAAVAAAVVAFMSSAALAQDARPARQAAEVSREAFVARAVTRAGRHFVRMDADANGSLSREERAADRQRRREAWQARQQARIAQ